MNKHAHVRAEIARYYAEKEKEARELAEQLKAALERGAPAEEIHRLERRLEMAYYVGD